MLTLFRIVGNPPLRTLCCLVLRVVPYSRFVVRIDRKSLEYSNTLDLEKSQASFSS